MLTQHDAEHQPPRRWLHLLHRPGDQPGQSEAHLVLRPAGHPGQPRLSQHVCTFCARTRQARPPRRPRRPGSRTRPAPGQSRNGCPWATPPAPLPPARAAPPARRRRAAARQQAAAGAAAWPGRSYGQVSTSPWPWNCARVAAPGHSRGRHTWLAPHWPGRLGSHGRVVIADLGRVMDWAPCRRRLGYPGRPVPAPPARIAGPGWQAVALDAGSPGNQRHGLRVDASEGGHVWLPASTMLPGSACPCPLALAATR